MVDIGAGQHKVVTFGVSPTLTSSRADSLSWYLPWRKQRLTLMEAGRLQGLTLDGPSLQCDSVTDLFWKFASLVGHSTVDF